MKRSLWYVVSAGAVASAITVAAQAPGEAPARPAKRIDARADQELKKMGEFLAKQSRFALEAEETYDEVPDGEPRVQLSNIRRAAVERPNRIAADATGDTRNRAAWFEGKSLTVLDKEHNVYATVEGGPTIDAMLDKMEGEYGVVLPLADLVRADPYKELIAGVTYGRYLGLHEVGGNACHHLSFAQETIEWQIWIDAGAEPLPRKLVISYVDEPGEPQYSVTIKRWSLDPKLPEGLFTFEAPEGAKKVDAASLAPKSGASPPGKPSGDARGGR